VDASAGRNYWDSESGSALAYPRMDVSVCFGSDANRDFRKNVWMGAGKNPKRADGIPAEKISGYRSDRTRNEGKSESVGNPGCQ